MASMSSVPSLVYTRAPSPRTMRTKDSRVGLAKGWRKADGMTATVVGGSPLRPMSVVNRPILCIMRVILISVGGPVSSHRIPRLVATGVAVLAVVGAACGGDDSSGAAGDRPTVVVTYSVLGAVVSDLVGDAADVVVLMPDGIDPHEWSPSAPGRRGRHERVARGDERVAPRGEPGGHARRSCGRRCHDFRRRRSRRGPSTIGDGEVADEHGDEHGDEHTDERGVGAEDPHLWRMDPLAVRDVVAALGTGARRCRRRPGDGAAKVEKSDLTALSNEVEGILADPCG